MSQNGEGKVSYSDDEILRWSRAARPALQAAMSRLSKAFRRLPELEHLVRKGRIEAATDLKVMCEHNVFAALGACIDPNIPGVEAADLARRTFFSASVAHKPGADDMRKLKRGTYDAKIERGEIARKVEAYADQVLKNKTTTIPSEEIVAALADKGWDAERFSRAWKDYLETVFDLEKGGTITQKREALKMFTEWKRSLEPRALIEMEGDLDTMSEEELAALQRRTAEVLVEEALRGS